MSDPVLILGASGGIGSAIARRLVSDGHDVVLHGRSRERLEALSLAIGPAACVEMADLSVENEVNGLFEKLRSRHGRLGGLVFAVATPFANKLTYRTPWEKFEEQIATQLKALHLSASAAFPLLAGSGRTRRFVLVGTEYVYGAPPTKSAPYVAAKAAMTTYAQVIAQEWLTQNIRVHIVAPGLVKTALVASLPDEFLAQIAAAMPEKVLTTAEDVAAVVSFQMTDAADPLYGTALRVSRGIRR